MVLCWIALPVFAILGIFSAKYRKLTKDAFECLFKTATFRKCSSGLDDRIKSDVTGTFLKYSPPTARFFYNNYKLISWIIVILVLMSAYFTGVGVYNYVKYGNCNGPNSNEFCIFNPFANTGQAAVTTVPNLTIEQKIENCMNTSGMTRGECVTHCSAK